VGKVSLPAQVLALIGLATLIGGVHSLVVPVRVTREVKPPVIPGEAGGDGEPAGPDAAPEGDPEAPDDGAGTAPADGAGISAGGEAVGEDGKIGLELAADLHERAMMGEPIWFLDARTAEDYDAGHIAGALHMSHTRLSSGDGLDEIMMFSPPGSGDLLVIYCTGGDCEASEDTAILLSDAGYGNIAIMSAGYDEWTEAGLPVEAPETEGSP
jgi:rhodanese-related sulfurtransferase